MSRRPTRADYDQVDLKVLGDVQREGWSDIGVFPTKDDSGLPFNYTVGLQEMSHPDLIIVGMHNAMGHAVLVSAVFHIKREMVFEENTYSKLILKDYRAAFVKVDDPLTDDYPMSMTTRFYDNVQALQVVWPDAGDQFPWHEGFSPDYKDAQPLLGTWEGPM